MLVIGGWCAVLFGVLAAPLVALSYVDFPAFGDFFGGDSAERPPPTTLPPLPRAQCDALRAVRDTGYDAYDRTVGDAGNPPWPDDRASIDDALAAYDFALALARRNTPVELRDDLRRVDVHVRNGRRALPHARNHGDYFTTVAGDVFEGYRALSDVEARLGDACGPGFSFFPRSLG